MRFVEIRIKINDESNQIRVTGKNRTSASRLLLFPYWSHHIWSVVVLSVISLSAPGFRRCFEFIVLDNLATPMPVMVNDHHPIAAEILADSWVCGLDFTGNAPC